MQSVVSPSLFLDAAKSISQRMIDLRRSIHAEPELGLDNPATRSKIIEEISDLGLEITLHEKTSGVIAILRGGQPGRRILLRGDTDALPMPEETGLEFRSRFDDRMHACGHDAHVAMLTGAARILAAHRDQFAGEIVFMFQPGEESYGGADIMLDEGIPETDAAFAIHVAPQIPTGMIGTKPGAFMASYDDFEIEIHGRGGHASMPHDCIDPIPIACEIVLALQAFVTRRIPATDPGVLTVTQVHSGTASNVIPDTAAIHGTMRALSDKTRALMLEGLPRIVEGIARTHDADARINLISGYPVVVNNDEFEALARDAASDLLGDRAILNLSVPVMGAEDFSYVLNRTPGAMVLLGVRPPDEKDPAPCHSSRMMLDESAMSLGAALHASVATRFLAV